MITLRWGDGALLVSARRGLRRRVRGLRGATVVDPLPSSPLGLGSSCAPSKQQHLNNKPIPAPPKNVLFPKALPPTPHHSSRTVVWISAQIMSPTPRWGVWPSQGPCIPPKHSQFPATWVLPFLLKQFHFFPQKRLSLGSASRWEYCQERLPCGVCADVLSWLGGHLQDRAPAMESFPC